MLKPCSLTPLLNKVTEQEHCVSCISTTDSTTNIKQARLQVCSSRDILFLSHILYLLLRIGKYSFKKSQFFNHRKAGGQFRKTAFPKPIWPIYLWSTHYSSVDQVGPRNAAAFPGVSSVNWPKLGQAVLKN